jgi:hypothetical protein
MKSPGKTLHRGNAQFFSPEKSPKTPKSALKVTSPMTSPKAPTLHFKTKTNKPLSDVKKALKEKRNKKALTMKAMKPVMKGFLKKKGSSSSSCSTPMKSKKAMKVFPPASPKKNKYQRWEHVRTKIDVEWNDVKGYNESFKCPPPCTYRKFLEGIMLLSNIYIPFFHQLYPSVDYLGCGDSKV